MLCVTTITAIEYHNKYHTDLYDVSDTKWEIIDDDETLRDIEKLEVGDRIVIEYDMDVYPPGMYEGLGRLYETAYAVSIFGIWTVDDFMSFKRDD